VKTATVGLRPKGDGHAEQRAANLMIDGVGRTPSFRS
jgi:hypothetical protein